MRVEVAGMDLLSEKAAMMRESLQKSQTITDNVVSILGSFDHRLSALETAMRPTQIRTHSIRKAHENIDKTLKAAEVILAQFELSRQDLGTGWTIGGGKDLVAAPVAVAQHSSSDFYRLHCRMGHPSSNKIWSLSSSSESVSPLPCENFELGKHH
ncbi:gag_pre-integrs domain-containing protein [Cephalotus follicularis]|uniref:Gag_pre-integrs domain-containing protein n=1 Tax=Cephalotus follicularis TaxID=3775 RepID=A0A1Q3D3L0_CEPFO|nr:gag_pre-integrs domain-containing protein [Cephalotus follicularis]